MMRFRSAVTPGPSWQTLHQTDRLLLCRPCDGDSGALFSFMGDPKVMRFTHTVGSLREMKYRLALHEQQRNEVGFAPWTIRCAIRGEVIGWGGLCRDPEDQRWGLELVYFLKPSVWGRGLALELALAAVALADSAGRRVLQAFAHCENFASRKVLARAGFREVGYLRELDRLQHERLMGVDSFSVQ
jgi:ribosomal-protein-alanine N-acetyltransferase